MTAEKRKKGSEGSPDIHSHTTIDHEEIKKWVEERDGKPAFVKATEGQGGPGIIRINFPGGAEESLENISWEEFFKVFDERKLAFLYQKETSKGQKSRFFKLVKRN